MVISASWQNRKIMHVLLVWPCRSLTFEKGLMYLSLSRKDIHACSTNLSVKSQSEKSTLTLLTHPSHPSIGNLILMPSR